MNSNQSNVQSKKLFEPANREELLRGWLLHAHKCCDRHELAARHNDTYRYWLGVPTIIFARVVGTSVFASLDAQVGASLKILWVGEHYLSSAGESSDVLQFCWPCGDPSSDGHQA